MPETEVRIRRYADAVLSTTSVVTVDEVKARNRWRVRPWTVRGLSAAAIALAVLGVAAIVAIDRDDTRVVAGPEFPLTLDGHRDWQLALLNGQVDPSDAEVETRYTDDFIRAVPAAKVRQARESLQAHGRWRVLSEIERRGDEALAVQLVAADEEQVRLTLHRTESGELDASTILRAVPCAEAEPPTAELTAALRTQMDWILAQLATGASPGDDELAAHVAPPFLDAVPPDKFRAALAKLHALRAVTMRVFEGAPMPHSLTARLGVWTGEEARLTLSIEPQAPHRITGFSVLTQQPCRQPVA